MTEEMIRRLVEFCGLCWHDLEKRFLPEGFMVEGRSERAKCGEFLIGYNCPKCDLSVTLRDDIPPQPNFTTPAGYAILHDKMGKYRPGKSSSEWSDFYAWLHTKETREKKLDGIGAAVTISNFHELDPIDCTEKSRLIAEYLGSK